jgi:hypothetical protein
MATATATTLRKWPLDEEGFRGVRFASFDGPLLFGVKRAVSF